MLILCISSPCSQAIYNNHSHNLIQFLITVFNPKVKHDCVFPAKCFNRLYDSEVTFELVVMKMLINGSTKNHIYSLLSIFNVSVSECEVQHCLIILARGRATLRHEWAVASWEGSTGVIPRPHRKPA